MLIRRIPCYILFQIGSVLHNSQFTLSKTCRDCLPTLDKLPIVNCVKLTKVAIFLCNLVTPICPTVKRVLIYHLLTAHFDTSSLWKPDEKWRGFLIFAKPVISTYILLACHIFTSLKTKIAGYPWFPAICIQLYLEHCICWNGNITFLLTALKNAPQSPETVMWYFTFISS